MNLVMDANALVAYLDDEKGAHIVEALLNEPANTCFAHGMNMCEVYYHFVRRADPDIAWSLMEGLVQAGVDVREDMDTGFWLQVGRHKAEIAKVSLADCCCITLAQRLGAELITADHHEFDPIADQGICPIRFIR